MSDPCEFCGKDKVMVGKSHHCVPTPAFLASKARSQATETQRTVLPPKGREKKKSAPLAYRAGALSAAGSDGSTDGRAMPVDGDSRTQTTAGPTQGLPPASVEPGPSDISPKRGRPRLGEVRPKPWIDAGMSRATWYSRKAEERKK